MSNTSVNAGVAADADEDDFEEPDFPASEAECLRLIHGGDWDATALVYYANPKLAAKFKRLDTSIRKLLAEAREYFPDAQYYTASGGFSLLLGSSHSDKEVAQQELSALTGLAEIGDGDY